ncbi:MAG: DUF1071 domain-containing protein [Gammaproteobacteria bacterium]|nr:DUF1071 domain-containing protein [Gammaproteobacteria bacterium]MBU1732637.1 DUF1071 domain-containing protein [Gammaproteobacteria bacterium]MBU1893500.1 DUF1071 domain-containing protein [Gammaproteobacteria bacterium]
MTNKQDSNYFTELAAINVGEHIERKGQFSYLSWPFAVAQLRQFDASATWEVMRFDGLPYLATDYGTFVEVAVTVRGITLSQIHPVLDSRNKPLQAPSVFDINTSIQRCLVKAIALHGLGLYIYAGEDLPVTSEEPRAEDKAPVSSTTRKSRTPPSAVTPIHSGKGITTAQMAQIEQLLDETGSDRNKLLAYFGCETLAEITPADFPRVIRSLEKRRAA